MEKEGKQLLTTFDKGAGGCSQACASRRFSMAAAVALSVIALAMCLVFAGCAPQQRTTQPGDGVEQGETEQAGQVEAVAFEWTSDSDCSMCHEKESSSQQDDACLASTHQDVACSTCHADQSGLEAAHEGAQPDGKGASALEKTTVAEAACTSCHDAADLATKTADSVVLTDSEGTVVNPHDLPENDDHAATECTSCHKMHSSTGVEKTATRYCKSCHHTDVYQCYTCHA